MERQAANFYDKAASQATDVSVRQLFTELAEVERGHEKRAEEITEAHLTADTKATEERAARRLFVLQYVQPGLAGLIDGSVSTLAPLFAAAFATHSNWETFLVGLAASVGAGISMGFTEALSDDGEITGRGSPWMRGLVCGIMTALGGLGHTLPYLIPDAWPNAFYVATGDRRGRGRGRARRDLVDPHALHGDAVLERHHAGHPRRRARAARRHLHRQRLTARDGGRELAPPPRRCLTCSASPTSPIRMSARCRGRRCASCSQARHRLVQLASQPPRRPRHGHSRGARRRHPRRTRPTTSPAPATSATSACRANGRRAASSWRGSGRPRR